MSLSQNGIKKFMSQIAYEAQVEMDRKILNMMEDSVKDNPSWCVKIEYEYPIDPLDGETLEHSTFRFVQAFRITREVCDCEDIFR